MVREIPDGKRGRFQGTVATSGAEVELGWKVNPMWSLGAYGATDWHGAREAGVRATAVW